MSLFIEGMDIPKHNGVSFDVCLLEISSDGSCEMLFNGKSYHVIEIPKPHGDLIDRDELLRKPIDIANYPSSLVTIVPAIIKKEES